MKPANWSPSLFGGRRRAAARDFYTLKPASVRPQGPSKRPRLNNPMKTIYTLVIASFLLAGFTGLAQTNRVIYSSGATRRASAAAARSALLGVPSNSPPMVTTIRLQGQALPAGRTSRAGAQIRRPVQPLDSSPTCTTPPGLVAWWADNNDDASDAFGNSPGTLQNDAGFCTGMVGDAFSFSGDSQAVEIPYCTNLTTANFSVEAWIQPFDQVDDPISQDLIFGQSYGRFQLLVRP